MKLTITQDNFKKAVSITERIVGKQIALPILENILFETKHGMLKVSATNLEIGVVFRIGAKIENEGSITIPARIIGSFVSNLPPHGAVILEKKNSVLQITSGFYRAQIKGTEAQEYPIIPESENNPLFSLSPEMLKKAASQILSCAATDNARPELTGINVIFYEKDIHLAATDSFRLAEAIIPIEVVKDIYANFVAKNQSIIIPAQTLSEVLRIVEGDNQKIQVAIEENQIFFSIGSAKIVSRLINGKYPEYKHIIPQKFATQIMVTKDDLLRAIKVSSIFTNSKSGEILLTARDKKIVIESQSVESGENKTEVVADIRGPEQKIVFNPRYILDGINSVSTNSLDLFINNGSSPAVIKMVDEKSLKPINLFTYVVMPIKN